MFVYKTIFLFDFKKLVDRNRKNDRVIDTFVVIGGLRAFWLTYQMGNSTVAILSKNKSFHRFVSIISPTIIDV